jgi:hypothetical protein
VCLVSLSFLGGVAGGLPVFELMPDLINSLCCGAVGGGIKFCMLGSGVCSFSTHSKKVHLEPGHLYISMGHNSTFTHHHAPALVLSQGGAW